MNICAGVTLVVLAVALVVSRVAAWARQICIHLVLVEMALLRVVVVLPWLEMAKLVNDFFFFEGWNYIIILFGGDWQTMMMLNEGFGEGMEEMKKKLKNMVASKMMLPHGGKKIK